MRLDELEKLARRRRLDTIVVIDEANLAAFTGVTCDNAVLTLSPSKRRGARPTVVFYTDFRYVPMVHRVAPALACRDIRRVRLAGRRIGFESSIPYARYRALRQLGESSAKFIDVADDLLALRAVKTQDEVERLRAAERLTCDIWREASAAFRPGMTERDMARIVRRLMVEKGDGEAFPTIVCVGANAAECHHEPDDTVWNGRDGVLVDLGVKLNGVCSDLTRNLQPKRRDALYRRVFALVEAANRAAIAAARPGMTAKALDKVARDVIAKGGFGKCFGHSLGHGVGLEIHEAPTVSKRGTMTLRPGMVFTIEPGIYLEGRLGVRIEDLVLLTESGCEVLSHS